MIHFENTLIDDLLIVKPDVFIDNRGYFFESYSKKSFESIGLNFEFVQDNTSFSKSKGTLRGLHYQEAPNEQTKLIYCLQGSILDVAVDLRKDSKTYLKWYSIELSSKNRWAMLVPKGFAHGFQTLENNTLVSYKVDQFYDKYVDRSIAWNDPTIKINWPIINPILSEKDKIAPYLKTK
jgi:dTDP-4-dehydrorhamnose 3,5-epimerase